MASFNYFNDATVVSLCHKPSKSRTTPDLLRVVDMKVGKIQAGT